MPKRLNTHSFFCKTIDMVNHNPLTYKVAAVSISGRAAVLITLFLPDRPDPMCKDPQLALIYCLHHLWSSTRFYPSSYPTLFLVFINDLLFLSIPKSTAMLTTQPFTSPIAACDSYKTMLTATLTLP